MKKKLKDINFNMAKEICNKHKNEYEDKEGLCINCKLNFDKNWLICGKDVIEFIEKYGETEIEIEENGEN